MSSPKFTTPKFRGSYCHLLKPHKIGDDDNSAPKYGMMIVLPKDEEATDAFIAKMHKFMKADMTEKFGKALPFEKCKHFPIRDGDEMTDDNGDQIEQFAGMWVINASNKDQPGLLVQDEDGSRRAIERDSEIYSGAWYHASVSVYAWNNKFGKGVSVSLSGVLKVDDDEKFGGSSFSEDEFSDVGAKKKPAGKKKPAADDDF